MKRSDRRPHRAALGLLLAAGLVGLAVAPVQTGCATQTTTVSTRALERSGRASFVCMGDRNLGAAAILPLTECNAATVLHITDYTRADIDGGVIKPEPHLYALVTQTTRGEVAVIDTTSKNNSVLDQDPSVPGANFLPVGAQPVDIVSTPGGTATFVGVAEIGREGLFALPSARIRPASTDGSGGAGGTAGSGPTVLPAISAWPSCRLPAAPGQMLLVADPAEKTGGNNQAATRPCCDADYGAKACSAGAPSPAAGLNGDIDAEGGGRQKLIIAMPSMGGVAVIDAQGLLDSEPGVYAPCNVERWLPLTTDVPVLPPAPPPGGVACVNPKVEVADLPANPDARPTGLAYAAGRLYASDLDTSLIHVIDLPTPCEPIEGRPLLPTSLDEPRRAVTTSHVAVAPTLTPDLKRYLYAVDARDGSAMVFDVSDDQASQFPLQRPHPEWDPFASSDRIRFAAPAADLVIVQRDVPKVDPTTGVAALGVRCSPDPSLVGCLPTSQSCDIAASYQTDTATYTNGAGPKLLRGTFAFLALTNGRVAVIDIDDLDSACRGPRLPSPLYGCAGAPTPNEQPLNTAKELSCNVVLPNTPRMGTYSSPEEAGRSQAGILGYPQLFDINGAPINDTDPGAARLVATVPTAAVGQVPEFAISVGGTPIHLDPQTGIAIGAEINVKADSTLANKSTLMMNLEDPRAQLADQSWFVVYEGVLPGFTSSLASFDLGGTGADGTTKDVLRDVNSRFCDGGVQSEKALAEKPTPSNPNETAKSLADYIHVQTELPDQADRYWDQKKLESPLVCDFNECRALFGSVDVPATGRDFRIVEAYQDHVEIEPRTSLPPTKLTKPEAWRQVTRCCFPSLVTFDVHVSHQWDVVGEQTGFLHHVITDPATGVCRDSCDPNESRRNGRAPRVVNPGSLPSVPDHDPRGFQNPMFRFAVIDPLPTADNKKGDPVVGQQFRWTTSGAFKALQVSLSADSSTLIQPVGMTYVPATGQLAVTDGSINGLLVIDLSSSTVVGNFF
ncbi:MAG: hypothetical protein ABJE95_07610 [Byssovorax sp.]